uniref:Prolyl 3-hydroxylase 2 n=1 Tax=Sphenodon punctatus TaxID=8508 RepID=A0A8D0GYU2_SPHPU
VQRCGLETSIFRSLECASAQRCVSGRLRCRQQGERHFRRRGLNQLDKAADAAHTFFMANPEHMEIQQDIENYKTMVGKVNLVDHEARPHVEDYLKGVRHYNKEAYELAIEALEQALRVYYTADVECRVLCEGPQRFEEYEYLEYSATLYEAIADHYMQVLLCQHECVRELATRPGRLSPIDNYLPLHYDYLQFAYYQVGDYVKALECAKSYLLFHPDDEAVLENESFYESLLGESMDPESIGPREEAATFVRRHKLESDVLQTAADGLGFAYTEPNYWSSLGARQDEHRVPSGVPSELADGPALSMGKKSAPKMDRELREGGPLLYNDVKFVYNSEQLNGTQRVLLDNVISEEECRELHRVANVSVGKREGDACRGKTSPHTPNEKFEGATVLKALKVRGEFPMLDSEEEQFPMGLNLPYPTFKHTLISGSRPLGLSPLPCPLPPSSALLYMNGDFEGGEFIFTEMDAKTVTASIKPKCGRMISFSSGGENPHGVKAVTHGQRCAVALWFTLDPLYRELERIQADEVIAALEQELLGPSELSINPKDEL